MAVSSGPPYFLAFPYKIGTTFFLHSFRNLDSWNGC